MFMNERNMTEILNIEPYAFPNSGFVCMNEIDW